MKLRVVAWTSKEARKRAVIETGEPISAQLEWIVKFADLPRNIRTDLADYLWPDQAPANDSPSLSATVRLGAFSVSPLGEMRFTEAYVAPDINPIEELTKMMDSYRRARAESHRILSERLTKWLDEARASIERLRNDEDMTPAMKSMYGSAWPNLFSELKDFARKTFSPDEYNEVENVARTLVSEWRAAQERKEQREEERRKAEKQARENEDRKWIAQFGSAHLKMIVDRGYDYFDRYVEERIGVEFPGFNRIDCKDWERRGSPSEKALRLAEEFNGEVVETEDGREAVVVKRPWMRHCYAIRIVRAYDD